MAADGYVEVECNSAIIKQIAEDMKLNLGTVEEVIKSVTSFTANTIKSGNLEGVMIPYLGKFQVKHRELQYKDFHLSIDKNLRPILKQNIGRIIDEKK